MATPAQNGALKRMAIYRLLRDAAERGEACPTNTEIAAAVGYRNPWNAGEAMRRLADTGAISVEGRGRRRVVTIAQGGASTAAPPSPPPALSQPARPKVAVREIVEIASDVWEVSAREIRSGVRSRYVVRPRQAVCGVAARLGWPVTSIGRAIGRDHKTVAYSRRKFDDFTQTDPGFAARVDRLDREVRAIEAARCAA